MRPTRDLLVRAARMTGYPVKLAWSSRDKGTMGDVLGVVEHHTGTAVNYSRLDDYPTLAVVRDGRAGLLNSLSAYGLGRSGTVYCISEKLSWHAGEAWWDGISDINGHYLGIEAESDGTYWTPAQTDCYPRLSAAILHVFGRGVGSHPRHKEVARPLGRKTDWAGLDDAAFDRAVAGYLANPASISRSTSTQEDDDMFEATDRNRLVHVDDILSRNNIAGRVTALGADMAVLKATVEGLRVSLGALAADVEQIPVPKPAVVYAQVSGRPEIYQVFGGVARHVTAEEWAFLGAPRDLIRPLNATRDAVLIGQLGIVTPAA